MEKLMLKECENCADWNGNLGNCIEICGLPFDALQEFNEYRKIGTVDECRVARQKIIAKQAINAEGKYFCPVCGRSAVKYYDLYCSWCGQALEWGD